MENHRNLSIPDLIIITQIIEKAIELNMSAYLCFMDYIKSFGCVQWHNLWLFYMKWAYQGTLYLSSRVSMKITESRKRASRSIPFLFNKYGECVMRGALEDWPREIILIRGRTLLPNQENGAILQIYTFGNK